MALPAARDSDGALGDHLLDLTHQRANVLYLDVLEVALAEARQDVTAHVVAAGFLVRVRIVGMHLVVALNQRGERLEPCGLGLLDGGTLRLHRLDTFKLQRG